jgi:hypothetical protein
MQVERVAPAILAVVWMDCAALINMLDLALDGNLASILKPELQGPGIERDLADLQAHEETESFSGRKSMHLLTMPTVWRKDNAYH